MYEYAYLGLRILYILVIVVNNPFHFIKETPEEARNYLVSVSLVNKKYNVLINDSHVIEQLSYFFHKKNA